MADDAHLQRYSAQQQQQPFAPTAWQPPGSSAGFGFPQTSSLQQQQQPRQLPPPPRTRDEALRCPAGRPPCPAVAFGSNGLMVVAGAGSGTISDCGIGSVDMYPLGPFLKDGGVDPDCEFLEHAAAVGPARGGSCNDKFAAVGQELAAHREQQDQASLWRFLGTYARRKGDMGVAGLSSGAGGAAELAAVLNVESAQTAGALISSASNGTTGPHAEATAAADVEAKLAIGDLAGAHSTCMAAGGALSALGLLIALSGRLGPDVLGRAAAEYTSATFTAGTPLSSAAAVLARNASAIFTSAAADNGAALLGTWRRHLASMVCAGAEPVAVGTLGDRLWDVRGDLVGAHLCYVLAGSTPEAFAPGARLCLVGGDHKRFPRTFARAETVLATECIEAAVMSAAGAAGSGASAHPASMAHFAPYKVYMASLLAEHGKGKAAAAYAADAAKALRAHSPSPDRPTAAMVAAIAMEDRLKGGAGGFLAGIGGNVGATASKMFGGIFRALDKVIGDAEPEMQRQQQQQHMQMHQGGGEANGHAHATPPRHAGGAGIGGQAQAPVAPANTPVAQGSTGANGMAGGESDTSKSESVDENKTPSKAEGAGVMGRMLSGLFGASKSKQAKLGAKENKFFYDEKLKMWRVEGEDIPDEFKPPPPPPKTSFHSDLKKADGAQAVERGIGGGAGAGAAGGGAGGGGTGAASAGGEGDPLCAPPPRRASTRAGRRANVRSRYVDTMGGSGASASANAGGGFATPPAPAAFMPVTPPAPNGGGGGGASPSPAAFMVPGPAPVAQAEAPAAETSAATPPPMDAMAAFVAEQQAQAAAAPVSAPAAPVPAEPSSGAFDDSGFEDVSL